MPVYTYRREDGTTFDYRQSFSDNPLTIDPATGQHVKRVVQAAGVIFKGSGFYVNDSKSASKKNLSVPASTESSSDKPAESSASTASSESTSASKSSESSDKASEKPSEKTAKSKKSTPSSAAAD